MSLIKDEKTCYLLNDYEPPKKKIISEGELLIKELVAKQSNTNITLNSELCKEQTFIKSTEFLPITASLSGYNTFKEFTETKDNLEKTESYKLIGLSAEESELLDDSHKGFEFLCQKHKNLPNEVVTKHLDDVYTKIEKITNDADNKGLADNFNNLPNRHFTEFGLCIKPNSTETKLLKFALNNLQNDNVKIPTALDNIKEIENTLFAGVNNEPVDTSKIRRKARKLGRKSALLDCGHSPMNNTIEPAMDERNSGWDKRIANSQVLNKPPKLYTCKKDQLYTIENGKIVTIEKKTESNLRTSETKLSVDDIKKIDKFNCYERGKISKTLYLRNLPNSLQLPELKLLFRECDDKITEYKLLNKRLRGKAFISFIDENCAAAALDEFLGIYVKGKPLIIAYGRNETHKDNGST